MTRQNDKGPDSAESRVQNLQKLVETANIESLSANAKEYVVLYALLAQKKKYEREYDILLTGCPEALRDIIKGPRSPAQARFLQDLELIEKVTLMERIDMAEFGDRAPGPAVVRLFLDPFYRTEKAMNLVKLVHVVDSAVGHAMGRAAARAAGRTVADPDEWVPCCNWGLGKFTKRAIQVAEGFNKKINDCISAIGFDHRVTGRPAVELAIIEASDRIEKLTAEKKRVNRAFNCAVSGKGPSPADWAFAFAHAPLTRRLFTRR